MVDYVAEDGLVCPALVKRKKDSKITLCSVGEKKTIDRKFEVTIDTSDDKDILFTHGSITDRPVTRKSMQDLEIRGGFIILFIKGVWVKGITWKMNKKLNQVQYCIDVASDGTTKQSPDVFRQKPLDGNRIYGWTHLDNKRFVKRWLHKTKNVVNKAGE
eukprot:UN27671